jgi:hypothetical protein
MATIRVAGEVDSQHRLSAIVPEMVVPGSVEILVFVRSQGEDDSGLAWASGIANEWNAELSDPREDIYSLNDGEPVDAIR